MGAKQGAGPGPVIECQFNLFDEGRKYTGHHRKYVLENAREVCYAPATREGIRLREKLGFLGHGRREMAGKAAIAESERVQMPDGSFVIVDNVPACVTTAFEIDEAGNVSHAQELLVANAPGRVVQGLHESRVGGFSWAMGGRDGGRHGTTRVSSFEGFDYVLNPGFSSNRGYVLESAETKDMVLESIAKAGIEGAQAEAIMHGWIASAVYKVDELTERLANAEIFESALMERVEALDAMARTARERDEARRALVTECARKSVVVVPADVADAMVRMASESDFQRVIGFFESAAKADLGRYPLPGSGRPFDVVKKPDSDRVYGRAAAAYEWKD
ncbi:MAG: hypothetical protein ABIL58_23175 [Pseudomonadota bacterium]